MPAAFFMPKERRHCACIPTAVDSTVSAATRIAAVTISVADCTVEPAGSADAPKRFISWAMEGVVKLPSSRVIQEEHRVKGASANCMLAIVFPPYLSTSVN